ncbi:MAG: hypothetical protein ATN35_09590 [Epulopiscium sp. Nele67-Bin004]|nr:MAG: hypothetical protein ATN35_09590 [Epulopiscium sp. Nele67-Bin004]
MIINNNTAMYNASTYSTAQATQETVEETTTEQSQTNSSDGEYSSDIMVSKLDPSNAEWGNWVDAAAAYYMEQGKLNMDYRTTMTTEQENEMTTKYIEDMVKAAMEEAKENAINWQDNISDVPFEVIDPNPTWNKPLPDHFSHFDLGLNLSEDIFTQQQLDDINAIWEYADEYSMQSSPYGTIEAAKVGAALALLESYANEKLEGEQKEALLAELARKKEALIVSVDITKQQDYERELESLKASNSPYYEKRLNDPPWAYVDMDTYEMLNKFQDLDYSSEANVDKALNELYLYYFGGNTSGLPQELLDDRLDRINVIKDMYEAYLEIMNREE